MGSGAKARAHSAGVAQAVARGVTIEIRSLVAKAADKLACRGLDAEALTTALVQLALEEAGRANAWAAEEDASLAEQVAQ